MKWATLDTNGHLEVRQGKPSLRDLQEAVGGLIEAFPLNDGSSIILNDEGKFAEVVVNNLAATMAAQEIGPGLFPGDFIAGNVAFIGPADNEGETTDLPDATLEAIRAIIRVGAHEHRYNPAPYCAKCGGPCEMAED